MTTDRFHKAAKDGLLDILKEATRRDCNIKDESGMTPTLWAAFEGNIEALRLLVSRGGDPDKADHWGNTALHLAASRGHIACVNFLISFGANLHSLDIDLHTPQDLAAINSRDQILRLLDAAVANLDATDRKKAKAMRERAKKDNEKRLKEYNKRQMKAEQLAEKEMKKMAKENNGDLIDARGVLPHRPSNVLISLKQKMQRAGSMGNLSQTGTNGINTTSQPYSALVGTVTCPRGVSGVHKKLLSKKSGPLPRFSNTTPIHDGEFKVSEVEDGKKSVRSLTGIRKDSEVMFVVNNDKRGKIPDAFNDRNQQQHQQNIATVTPGRLSRTLSQPDFLHNNFMDDNNLLIHEPSSIFERPGIGSIAFRKTLNGLTATTSAGSEECSIGSAGSLAARQQRKLTGTLWDPDTSDCSVSSDDDESEAKSGLERFLAAWGLSEYVDQFLQEKVDLEALMLLTEDDLRQLSLPIGHHRKLATAIAERRSVLQGPTPPCITDSRL